ncbi:MAG TPA: DUF6210 family protein [Ramlibacter sp.]|uniref:DUF6210 family protein n=1 Tax=Ramlibacter sp. TaxID=1917967 RepID=UPI002ECFBEB0
MLRVNLVGLGQCGLIIPAATGVTYDTQVCGTLCRQTSMEGVLVPLDWGLPPDSKELSLDVRLERLLGEIMGLNDELADSIDAILGQRPESSFVTVDRAKLNESCEAWIYVNVREAQFGLMQGFGACKGVLTWPNSD